MEPIAETRTLPLSISALDAEVTLEAAPERLPVPDETDAMASLSSEQKKALGAVTVRAGEVEAAEWALDQAKTACNADIEAAIAAGVPADLVAAAAGVCASAIGKLSQEQAPAAEAS